MIEDNSIFDAPIPGQSLTAEVGARPWQQPAQFPTVEGAFEFYVKKITNPEINNSLLDALEMGTPVTSITEILVQSGAMEGVHTIDVSIQLLPVLMELIAYIAEDAGVEYNMGIQKKIDQDVISDSELSVALHKVTSKKSKESKEMPMVEPEAMPEERPQTSGIMSRRM